MKKAIIFILLFVTSFSFAQNDTTKKIDYSFIIQDSPMQLFTMRQTNINYLSGYRLFAKKLYSTCEKEYTANLILLGLGGLFFMPMTHEEGHRSILTANKIGAISQPYVNQYGACYVIGVNDSELQSLRDNYLPCYIRVHTAGLESDYMLTKRMETIASFEQDDFKNYDIEYLLRKFAILQYYVLGLFHFDIIVNEEANELERDIVGYDTYGAARHLYRPTMDFYRYTSYKDLTTEEKKFVNRLGYRSLLNLINPLIFGKTNFKITDNLRINAGLGYTMSPFGDFVDENLWIKLKSINIAFYARQFQNNQYFFNGFGLSLVDYQPIDKLCLSLSGHFWQQPVDLDFNTSKYFTGGAVDLDLKFFFLNKFKISSNSISIDLGLIYKTKGFMPEEIFLDKHFGIRIGTTIRI